MARRSRTRRFRARTRIYRGTRASSSARTLADALSAASAAANGVRGRVRVLLRDGSRFQARPGDTIINWGASNKPEQLANARWLNEPNAVSTAVHKLRCLERLTACEVPCVQWTTSRREAEEWLTGGDSVVARTVLNGTCGRGITLVNAGEVLPDAPLYTKYFKGYDEYRVHVMGGNVIDVQQKRRRGGLEDVNDKIRNTANGWVFCREGVELPDAGRECARGAVHACGLDYGAVDLKYNRHYGTAATLEINTAPGLEGTTIERYRDNLRRIYGIGQ